MTPTRMIAAMIASAAILTAVSLGIPAAAKAATVTTTTSDGIQFTADDSNVAAGAQVTGYTGSSTSVVIPATVIISGTTYAVTSIAAGTEPDLDFVPTIGGAVTSVVIPDSVTDIGEYSFYNDLSLTSVTFGSGITAIHDGAFQNDPLGSIALPHSLTYIGAFVFIGARETTLVLPEGLADIEGQAFLEDPLLTTVTLPSSLTSLNSDVFYLDPELSTVLFLGGVPANVTDSTHSPSFDASHGLVVSYLWAHAAAQEAGGFASPTWLGYTTQELVTRTFDANGFGTAPAAERFDVSTAAAKPADPTAPGKAFLGWYTTAALTTKANFADPVTADQTLYAGWASLATTGVDVTALGAPAGVALIFGLALIVVSRRRRVLA